MWGIKRCREKRGGMKKRDRDRKRKKERETEGLEREREREREFYRDCSLSSVRTGITTGPC